MKNTDNLCMNCEGTGEVIEDGQIEDCPDCYFGYEVDPNWQECDRCWGDGCNNCEGEGGWYI